MKIIGVRFEKTGKIYSFNPLEFEVERGDKVIVETVRGIECGHIVLSPREIDESTLSYVIKPIIRKATEEDIQENIRVQQLSDEAFELCKKIVVDENIPMKIVKASYTFDTKKLLFYFVADTRIDFRNLVKRLASEFKTRIELRQIGARDASKKIGGIGSCGRALCCSTFLSEFEPIAIKMLKEQNASLNPTQLSGHCGRLMCCLSYDQHTYEELNKVLPSVGEDVTIIETGEVGRVEKVHVLKQEVTVLVNKKDDEVEIIKLKYDRLKYNEKS